MTYVPERPALKSGNETSKYSPYQVCMCHYRIQLSISNGTSNDLCKSLLGDSPSSRNGRVASIWFAVRDENWLLLLLCERASDLAHGLSAYHIHVFRNGICYIMVQSTTAKHSKRNLEKMKTRNSKRNSSKNKNSKDYELIPVSVNLHDAKVRNILNRQSCVTHCVWVGPGVGKSPTGVWVKVSLYCFTFVCLFVCLFLNVWNGQNG